jgi:hypothetical protein
MPESKGQQWFKLITGFIITILTVGEGFILLSGPSKMRTEADKVIHSEETKKETQAIVENAVAEQIFMVGAKEYLKMDSLEGEKLKDVAHFAVNNIEKIKTSATREAKMQKTIDSLNTFVKSLRGVALQKADGLYFREPTMVPEDMVVDSKVYYNKEGRNWAEDQYWRIDKFGKNMSMPLYKNIILQR